MITTVVPVSHLIIVGNTIRILRHCQMKSTTMPNKMLDLIDKALSTVHILLLPALTYCN